MFACHVNVFELLGAGSALCVLSDVCMALFCATPTTCDDANLPFPNQCRLELAKAAPGALRPRLTVEL
jgi:hypothetical protein